MMLYLFGRLLSMVLAIASRTLDGLCVEAVHKYKLVIKFGIRRRVEPRQQFRRFNPDRI